MNQNEKAAAQKSVFRVLKFVVLILMLVIFVFPFFMVIINVFKTKADITSNPLALVGAHGFTLTNFPRRLRR